MELPYQGAETPEADYTAWNILALLMVVLLLSVTGMLMDDTYDVDSSVNPDPYIKFETIRNRVISGKYSEIMRTKPLTFF